jgi:alkanesulfonate monooxygenase SsuD/methylene tetrahydromethanopterin reductase-like flavin-dependent oxidoreductase (luciferase family)
MVCDVTADAQDTLSVGYLVPTREAVMFGRPEAEPLLALAAGAEELGYDSVWVGDSLVARPRHEPLTLLTAIAARTRSVTLGTAVLLPVLRHPVVMAHQVATLDQIAEGRVVLGLGIAADTPPTRHEFTTVGLPFERRVGRFNDHLDLCRRLWTEDRVTHHGPFYDVDDVGIGPMPHRPGGPPLWVAAGSAPGQRRAGRRYDGWMPIGHSADYGDGWVNVVDAAIEAGRDPGQPGASAYLTISLGDDPARAEAVLDEYLAAYYPGPPATMRALQATYAGPRADLAAWVQPFVDAGARHFILRFAGAHEDHLDLCSTLRDELMLH